MERMTRPGALLVALLMVALLGACGSKPVVKTVAVQLDGPPVQRPQLPVETLAENANASEVFRAYEASLLLCIGYAKQLEVANRR